MELVAVAAVVADHAFERGAAGAAGAVEGHHGVSDLDVEVVGEVGVGGLGAHRLLRGVHGQAVLPREQLVERLLEVVPVEAGQEAAGVPPRLERHRLPCRAVARARPARPSARRRARTTSATSAGGATASTRTTRVDGVFPRRRMSWVNEARCRCDCTRGRRDERALALHPAQHALGDERLDGAAHGGARDGIRLHQLALGGDRAVGCQLGGGHPGQHGAQLRVLRLGAVGDRRAARSSSVPLDPLALVLTGTVQSVPVRMHRLRGCCQPEASSPAPPQRWWSDPDWARLVPTAT